VQKYSHFFPTQHPLVLPLNMTELYTPLYTYIAYLVDAYFYIFTNEGRYTFLKSFDVRLNACVQIENAIGINP